MKNNSSNESNIVKTIDFKYVQDPRGDLIEVEFLRDIPFKPKRVFFVTGVPSSKIRGEHAHKECHECLVCLTGSLSVIADNGVEKEEHCLTKSNQGLYLPPYIWGIQYKYSPDAVLMVYASHEYDPDDYIRDYAQFIKEIGNDK